MANNKKSQWAEKPRIWMIILLGIVLFVGTGLAATYFNEDVDMVKVQEKLFFYISGEEAEPDFLAMAYCIGIAVGVILFFNPFMMGKKSTKPTPMELKYFEYEDTMQQMKQAEKKSSLPSVDTGKNK